MFLETPKNSWRKFFFEESQKPYFHTLMRTVEGDFRAHSVMPAKEWVFRAFNELDLPDVRCVILGMDPYPNPRFPVGLSFSIPHTETKIPQSLKNIYTEISNEYDDFRKPDHGDLSSWLTQGVMLLNSILTIKDGKTGSHKKIGWETFTDNAISYLSNHTNHVVFILWGNDARKKSILIDESKHLIIESAHPSPFSARKGFFGSNCFIRANAYLLEHEKTLIDWKSVSKKG